MNLIIVFVAKSVHLTATWSLLRRPPALAADRGRGGGQAWARPSFFGGLDISGVDEIYEIAICPRSSEAPAEPGTIWLVRDFLPLFLLSEPDSWMPANRGQGGLAAAS